MSSALEKEALEATPLLAFERLGARSRGIVVDLNRLVESRLLIQSNSGGGKSRAIRYLCEQTHGRIQQIILDREGEFATLREKFPYVLVGRDGDKAADVRTAKLLARRLLELRASAVIDMSEMTLGQQREYVRVFIDAINHLPRELWRDCLIIIDEAHLFAPEKGKGSSVAAEAIAMLLSTGRKRGYCGVLATQRLAKLDKDAAAECLNKWIGRTSSEDERRAADELGQGKQEARALRSLIPGQFWVYGPATVPDPYLVRTGEVKTAPPKRGAAHAEPPAAPDAIKKVLAELGDLPAQAAEEERTTAELRAEVSKLTAQVRKLESGAPPPVIDKAALVAEYRRGFATAEQNLVSAYEPFRKSFAELTREIQDIAQTAIVDANAMAGHIRNVLARVQLPRLETGRVVVPPARILEHEAGRRESPPPPRAHPIEHRKTPPTPRYVPSSDGAPQPEFAGVKGELQILNVIAQYPDGADSDQISVLAGKKRSSRNEYVRRLRKAGLIEERGGRFFITEAGMDALGDDFQPLPSGRELREYWLKRLVLGEAKILSAAIDAHPGTIHRDEVTEQIGLKRSSRNEYIRRLLARRLITDAGSGEIGASSTLFTDGAR